MGPHPPVAHGSASIPLLTGLFDFLLELRQANPSVAIPDL